MKRQCFPNTDAIIASENDDFPKDMAIFTKALRMDGPTNEPTDHPTEQPTDGHTFL